MNIVSNFFANSMNYFFCSDIRFNIDFQVCINIEVLPILLETTNTK